MNPIIFKIPSVDSITLDKNSIYYTDRPSPKLLKYGFNDIDNSLNIVELTKNSLYKKCLNFSKMDELEKRWKIKDAILESLSLWEIFKIFDLFGNESISVDNVDAINDIITGYNTVSKKKIKPKIVVRDSKKKSKETYDIVIGKYAEIDLDENGLVHNLLEELPNLFSLQGKKSTMILQLFSIQTKIMVQLITFLSTLYDTSYLIRPASSSDLSAEKFLVLKNLKKPFVFPVIDSGEMYVANLTNVDIPDNLNVMIQCINANLIPIHIESYNRIKNLLKDGNIEGDTDLKKEQEHNITYWISNFVDSNKTESKEYLNDMIQDTSVKCQDASFAINDPLGL